MQLNRYFAYNIAKTKEKELPLAYSLLRPEWWKEIPKDINMLTIL